MLLEGKTALITGGARGIGREIIRRFIQEGANIYYIDLEEGDSLSEYQNWAREKGLSVEFRAANVSDEEEISSVVSDILKEPNGLDILVNNAGITRDGLIFRMKSQDWLSVLSVNLTSAFYISKLVSRHLIQRKGGAIINMASIVGVIGNGGQCNYSASKAGLIGLTKSLARELGSRNVRVNAVAPGYIQTKMTDELKDAQKEALNSQIPMGRIGLPEEVAKAVLFLASDLSSYITGHVLHVTGGLGM
jgi:3-oxoacyl-[acyl-carrier protein] reductase